MRIRVSKDRWVRESAFNEIRVVDGSIRMLVYFINTYDEGIALTDIIVVEPEYADAAAEALGLGKNWRGRPQLELCDEQLCRECEYHPHEPGCCPMEETIRKEAANA